MTGKYREDKERGPVHVYLGPETFVEEDSAVFLCKSGQVGMAFSLTGVDYSCVPTQDLNNITTRWMHAIKIFTPQFEIRQYAFKTSRTPIPVGEYDDPEVERLVKARAAQVASAGADLYTVELYAVILLDTQIRQNKRKPSVLASSLRDACQQLRSAVASFIQHVHADIAVRPLDKDGAYNFLRRLVNFDSDKITPRKCPVAGIDYAACDSRVWLIWEDERHRDPYLLMENIYAKVMTLKLLPSPETKPNMLAKLYAIPCDCILASSWRSEDVTVTLSDMSGRMNRFFRKSGKQSDGKNAVDMTALSDSKEMSLAKKAVEKKGLRCGFYSLYAVLWGDETRVNAATVEAQKLFQMEGGSFMVDHMNQLGGYLSILPGGRQRDRRRHKISIGNYAELSTIFSLDSGSVWNPDLNAEYLTVFESKPPEGLFGRTPYFFDPLRKGGRHLIVDGTTDSGKTFFLKLLASHARKYGTYTCVLDMKQSFRGLTKKFGGSFISFADRAFRINPLMLPESDANIQFLCSFVEVLIELGKGTLTAEDREMLHRYIRAMYQMPAETRCLSVLQGMLRVALRDSLAPWVTGGRYGWCFDHEEDNLSFADWQSFEFEGMDNYAEAIEPLLFYVLHRVRQAVFDQQHTERLKLLILDEAWRLIKHPVIRAYMEEAVRTYRDKNGVMVICTQSINDVPATLLDFCPNRIIMRHNRVDRQVYEEVAQLNRAAIDEMEKFRTHGEFLWSTPKFTKVLQFNASPEELLAFQ